MFLPVFAFHKLSLILLKTLINWQLAYLKSEHLYIPDIYAYDAIVEIQYTFFDVIAYI